MDYAHTSSFDVSPHGAHSVVFHDAPSQPINENGQTGLLTLTTSAPCSNDSAGFPPTTSVFILDEASQITHIKAQCRWLQRMVLLLPSSTSVHPSQY
ncbi:hypothetical protein V6N13_109828 [Hibiscus sabdariffa]|uniref:Uncharacterized protein n=1 Tax=Hibiscus sabdariffa TaxID=183260 RepID=A0ABR2FQM6_9ROSI